MSLKKPNPTTLIHQILTFCASRQQRESPGLYIDATAGRGRDTLFLCRLAQDREKETGRFCRFWPSIFRGRLWKVPRLC